MGMTPGMVLFRTKLRLDAGARQIRTNATAVRAAKIPKKEDWKRFLDEAND